MKPQLVSATTLYPTAKIATHVSVLDRLLDGGLLPGLLTVIHSNHGARSLKNLIIRLLKQGREGAVIIDATNQFPAIQLARWARQQRKKPQAVLSKFKILRPFNYHQCTEAALKYLEKEVQNHPSQLLLILGCPDIYLSDEAAKNLSYDQRTPTFALLELHQALRTIQSVTMKYGLGTILTTGRAPGSLDKPLGGPFLRASAGIIIRVEQVGIDVEYTLDKHPFLASRKIAQKKQARGFGSANLTKWILAGRSTD
ncbi:MAG: hypothetical protein ACE5OZ_17195 [Candidatus Heimdallarchaeota archaeon]